MDNGERTFGELLTYLREQKRCNAERACQGNWSSAPFLSDVEQRKTVCINC